ncbi:hypothetical protein [Leptospira andrefontaineae]|uniref:Uncharacterized protein n=1 Tax=Leptospira andrefontaineae TaxID=2484976 RepID=A0A4R9H8V0_9LEPT|nr:hypothetical protein [Leptospira andrefontaineae]TGK42429.1 hypothetical protein EHO65_06635 [Leptospira andrefontaineae]
MKNILVRVLSFGFLVWLVPFVVAMGFFSPERKLLVDMFTFKTVMLLVGTATGSYLLFLLSKRIQRPAFKTFLFIGAIWLIENWILDFVILLPLSGMSVSDYFVQIGLRYVQILFVAAAIGAAIDRHP